MSLPVLEDRKFLGDIVVDGTAAFASTVGITGALTAPQIMRAIADPGTGAAIPITQNGVVAITTAAAETNTLAIPARIDAKLILICDVYAVGDRVVTVAAKVNQATNTVLTFGAAGDMCVLEAVQEAGTLRWQITANDGVGLS